MNQDQKEPKGEVINLAEDSALDPLDAGLEDSLLESLETHSDEEDFANSENPFAEDSFFAALDDEPAAAAERQTAPMDVLDDWDTALVDEPEPALDNPFSRDSGLSAEPAKPAVDELDAFDFERIPEFDPFAAEVAAEETQALSSRVDESSARDERPTLDFPDFPDLPDEQDLFADLSAPESPLRLETPTRSYVEEQVEHDFSALLSQHAADFSHDNNSSAPQIAPPAVETPPPLPATPDSTPVAASSGGKLSVMASVLALLGIGVGGAGFWQAHALNEELVALRKAQSQQPAPVSAPTEGLTPRIDLLEGRVENLMGAVESLQAEPPPAPPGSKPAVDLQPLSNRLDKLEVGMAQLVTKLQRLDDNHQTLAAKAETAASRQQRLEESQQTLAAKTEAAVNRVVSNANGKPAPTIPAQPSAPPAPAAAPPPAPAPVNKPSVAVPARTPVVTAPDPKPGNGPWVVNLVSVYSDDKADSEIKRLTQKGLPVEKSIARQNGKSWYRIQVSGFTSYQDAKIYLGKMQKDYGLHEAWISKNR